MEIKSKKELPNLPESENEFWDKADKHVKKIEHTLCKHKFFYKSAIEVECENCNIGFILTKDWDLKDKQIYYKDQLVI